MNQMELYSGRSGQGNVVIIKLSFLGLCRLKPLFLKTHFVISVIWYFKEEMQNLKFENI